MDPRLMSIDYSKIKNLDPLVEQRFAAGQITPLMATIVNTTVNNPRHVRKVLENHNNYAFLNRPDPVADTTPLMQLAVAETQIPHAPELVAMLLEPKYGVDIHARSGPAHTQAIFGAAELGSTQIVKMLLDRGADVMSSSPHSPSRPINVAIANNHYEIVAHFVNAAKKTGQLKEMLNTINKYRQTAAQVAMIRWRTEIVGIMARAAGDLRNSFYAVWDHNPSNEERFVYVDPDPEEYPEAGALYKTVYSFVSKTCCYCREPVSDEKKTVCSSCTMAWYCGADCQRSDWKAHKKCCKKLKKGVDLVLGTGKRQLVPYPLVEQTGFEEDFVESMNQLQGPDYDYDYEYAWEYHGIDENDSTKRVWKKYPPLINQEIEECKYEDFEPRFSYRPNKEGCRRCQQAPFPPQAPPNVATRIISFKMMMEFDVYTGAARAVRRVGAPPPPPPPMPQAAKDLMAQFMFQNTRGSGS